MHCGGNSFQEPGAFHYLPGNTEIPMSFNGCKDPGCVRYGMKKIHVSPRLSYYDAMDKFTTYQKFSEDNASWIMRKYDPSPKGNFNGRLTIGVKNLQSTWFDIIKCSRLSDHISNTLKYRRLRMLFAVKVYCADKQYCGGRKSI